MLKRVEFLKTVLLNATVQTHQLIPFLLPWLKPDCFAYKHHFIDAITLFGALDSPPTPHPAAAACYDNSA